VSRLSGGTEDNDLWVQDKVDPERPHELVVASVWEPTLEERARIAAGENIELLVWGGQPPVALRLTDVALGRAPAS
jgi:hypothetical protein